VTALSAEHAALPGLWLVVSSASGPPEPGEQRRFGR
jgi:hypothetical protein